jgi:hypothetical protein
MAARYLSIGDTMIVSLGNSRGEYIVRYVGPEGIFISPENEPKKLTQIVNTNIGLRIVGDLTTEYQFEFRETLPATESPIVKSPQSSTSPQPVERTIDNMLTEEEKYIADICSRVSVNPRAEVTVGEIEQMRQFAQRYQYPEITDTLNSRRMFCQTTLENILIKLEPDLDTGKFGLNLGRHYRAIKEREEGDRLQREREQEQRQRELFERAERIRKVELIKNAKQILRSNRKLAIRNRYIDRSVCRPQIINDLQGLPIIDPNLTGRRVLVSKDHWRAMAHRQPVSLNQYPQILEEIRRRFRVDGEDLDNSQIRGVLGDARIRALLGDVVLEAPSQYHLKITSNTAMQYPTFAQISGYHDNGDHGTVVKVSEEVMSDLDNYTGLVTISDCILEPVETINLFLYRNGDIGMINEDQIKERLIDHLSNAGAVIVGDVINISVGTEMSYSVDKLITRSGEVYAAAISPVSTDVKISLDAEKTEDLQAEIGRITGETIDLQML